MTIRRGEVEVNPGAPHGSVPNARLFTATNTSRNIMYMDGLLIVTAAALTGSIDITLGRKMRLVDFWAVGTAAGAAADTIQALNNGNAISDALDMNVVDTTLVRASTLDDAFWDIDPDAATTEVLRITGASAVNAIAYARLVPVA